MSRKINPNKIKSQNSYKFSEIAQTYGLHKQTIQVWHKQGLKVIDEKTRPFLVYGEDLREFIKAKFRKRKIKLNEGEFYCTKCHAARRSAGDVIRIEYTEKRLGNQALMVFIKGNCEDCGTVLTMFSSDRKLKEMFTSGKVFMVQGKGLTGNDTLPLNTNIMDESKNGSNVYMQLLKKSS